MGAPGALRLLGLGTRHRHGSCSGTLPQGHLEILEDFGGWTTRTRGKQHLVWVVVSIVFYIFTSTWGNDPIWRSYFSDGLKPPPIVVDWFHQFFWFPLFFDGWKSWSWIGFKHFWKNHPEPWGNHPILLMTNIFQLGWNRQLLKVVKGSTL